MNNRPYLFLVSSVVVAGALLGCGLLIRNGLLALSTQLHDKQVSPVPAEIRLAVGNPDLKISFADIRTDGRFLDGSRGATGTGNITIDKVQIEVPASPPPDAHKQ